MSEPSFAKGEKGKDELVYFIWEYFLCVCVGGEACTEMFSSTQPN